MHVATHDRDQDHRGRNTIKTIIMAMEDDRNEAHHQQHLINEIHHHHLIDAVHPDRDQDPNIEYVANLNFYRIVDIPFSYLYYLQHLIQTVLLIGKTNDAENGWLRFT